MPPQESKTLHESVKRGFKKVLWRKHKNLLERKLPKNYEPETVHYGQPPLDDKSETYDTRTFLLLQECPSILPPHMPSATALPRVCLSDDDWATFHRLPRNLRHAHLAMCRIASCLAWHEDPHDIYLQLPNDDFCEISVLRDNIAPGTPCLPLDVEPTFEDYEHFLRMGYVHTTKFYIGVSLSSEEPEFMKFLDDEDLAARPEGEPSSSPSQLNILI